MEPIIKVLEPFPYIKVIKVYEPQIMNNRTISFLIKINDSFSKIDLNEEGNWVKSNVLNKYPVEVLNFIYHQIELKYLNG